MILKYTPDWIVYLFSPLGLANIISALSNFAIRVKPLIDAIAAIEVFLIIIGKYPPVIKLKLNKRLVVFLLLWGVNLTTNIIMFLWFATHLGI